MNAPDKIYRVFGKDTYIDVENQPVSENYCEYISKEVILEWLSERKRVAELTFSDSTELAGYMGAVSDFMNKFKLL